MKNCFGGTPLGDMLYFLGKPFLREYDGLPCTYKFKSEIQTGGRNGKYVCMGKKIWRSPLFFKYFLF